MSGGPLRRIHLIGDQESGETTLARLLAGGLGLPIYHLDDVVRDPAKERERSRDELCEIGDGIATSPACITEGLHAGSTSTVFEHADRVIWLDTVGRAPAARRTTRRFAGNAWAEMCRRNWRCLYRFRDYNRHRADLARTMSRVVASDQVAPRDAAGAAGAGDVEALLAGHPERLVHCRCQADVDALVGTLVTPGLDRLGDAL